MARTRTPGIRLDHSGGLIIDKEHRGIPIYFRLGRASQEEAEQRLTAEVHGVDVLLQGKANRRPTFADCAAATSLTQRPSARSTQRRGTSDC